MDVLLVPSSAYSLPSQQRVGAIVFDGAADLELWPGRGPDSDLREAWGAGLQETLRAERERLDSPALPVGEGLRIHPGRLHCDMLLWLATRPPEPGTEREPAPDLDLLHRSVRWALGFLAARDVARVAFPPLGWGPGERPRPERVETIVRAAHEYEEACFAGSKAPVIEAVVVCEPDGPCFRDARQRVRSLARSAEPAPARAEPPSTTGRRRSAGASTGRRRAARGLDPQEVARARSSASPYDRTRTYAEGDWFVHPKFGAGRVEQVTAEGAVVVRFEGGEERKMLHGRG